MGHQAVVAVIRTRVHPELASRSPLSDHRYARFRAISCNILPLCPSVALASLRMTTEHEELRRVDLTPGKETWTVTPEHPLASPCSTWQPDPTVRESGMTGKTQFGDEQRVGQLSWCR